jgi:hypothetical protein
MESRSASPDQERASGSSTGEESRRAGAGEQSSAVETREVLLATGSERAKAIMGNTPGRIQVADNPKAKATPNPWYAASGAQEVTKNERLIEAAASRNGLDPDLVKAIAWIESTHGWYDRVTGVVRAPKTIRPMNVHVEFWKDRE